MMETRDYLLLRLEAPLMAFGGPIVDHIGRTRDLPGQSQIAGLLGNALGVTHGDAAALEALQGRLRLAALLARPGALIRDYHTVDLGRPHLTGTGWTTRGRVEERAGASSDTTHIRHRWYRADALVVVAVTLDPPDVVPDLGALAAALDHPARPLFIGRKPCLPTAPIRLGDLVEAATAEAALRAGLARLGLERAEAPLAEIDRRLVPDPPPEGAETEGLVDRRDWRNQMHTGMRSVYRFPLRAAGNPRP